MLDLRPYQANAIEQVRGLIRAGKRRILLVAPTGSGKTVIGSSMAKGAHEKRTPVLWMAHRRELIHQACDKLSQVDVSAGIILSGVRPSLMVNTQVASIQTYASRIWSKKSAITPMVKLLFIDEAHHATSDQYLRLIADHPDAIVIGLTATPCRTDGRGLGHLFDAMVEVSSVAELTELGYLVPTKIYAPRLPDLEGIHTRAGDYVGSELEERMSPLVGHVVDDWHRYGENRQTVVYASSVNHSIALTEEFNHAGITAAHIDGKTKINEREAILAGVAAGDIQVVSNFGVLTEGWDMPSIGCEVIARPTKSYGLYLQMAGRVLRPAPGKEYAVIIDHAGAVYRHGLPQDAGGWSLDESMKIQDKKSDCPTKEKTLTTCRNCWHIYTKQQRCPKCGCQPTREGQSLSMKEGRLQPVKKAQVNPKEKFWNDCLWRCAKTHKQVGVAAHMYKKRFGSWPRGFRRMPQQGEWKMGAAEWMDVYKNRAIKEAQRCAK